MCLIITKTKNVVTPIPANYIQNASTNNPDGFGIIGKANDGAIYTAKTLDMLETLDIIRSFESENMDIVAHWRYRTHGPVNDANTHPFKLHGENYIVHNGILDIPTPNEDYSDTWHFTENLKSAIGAKTSFKKIKKFFAKTHVGASKFAMLGVNIPLVIVNKNLGVTKDDIWYSNSSNFKSPAHYDYKKYDNYLDDYYSRSDFMESDYTSKDDYAYTPTDSASAEYINVYNKLESDTATIDDLSSIDQETLSYLCAEYPKEIARAIREF